jgi:hypothetical protein
MGHWPQPVSGVDGGWSPAAMLALVPAAMLVATGALRVKIWAAVPPPLTACRQPLRICGRLCRPSLS